MTARNDNLALLNSPDGRAGLRSLTAVERALFGGLISAFTLLPYHCLCWRYCY